MGAAFKFDCPSCGYSAEVTGDATFGFMAATETVVCLDCKQLYDVGIGRVEPPDYRVRPEDRVAPLCPNDERHSVETWKAPGPCPRCGAQIEQGAMTVLWD